MSYEIVEEIYNNLCEKRMKEFVKVCSKDKTVKNAIHKLLQLAFKSTMGAFFRFSVILACISELNEPALETKTNKITPKIKSVCELFISIFNEINKIACELDKL